MTPFPIGFAQYACKGRAEPIMMRYARYVPQLLIISPFFSEMNCCRRLIADMMADLATLGIASWLPDLPGTGESSTPLEHVCWEDWREAIRAAARVASEGGDPVSLLSIRGGALLDDAVEGLPRWRLSPASGAALWRDLIRARLASEASVQTTAAALREAADKAPVELAGYRIAPGLSRGLREAEPRHAAPLRTARLEGDRADADILFDAQPVWRRAEPGRNRELARAIATDVANWVQTCAHR